MKQESQSLNLIKTLFLNGHLSEDKSADRDQAARDGYLRRPFYDSIHSENFSVLTACGG